MTDDLSQFKPFIGSLVKYYYEDLEQKGGGLLHVVLDDGNIDRDSIWYCRQECEKAKDGFGLFLCDVLVEFTEEELESLFDNDWQP